MEELNSIREQRNTEVQMYVSHLSKDVSPSRGLYSLSDQFY